eukprot:403371530
MITNYDFQDQFQQEFEGFSREHEQDSQGLDWNNKISKMKDSDFFAEGLQYRKKQRELHFQEELKRKEWNESHKNEIRKKLIAQKLALENQDLNTYNHLAKIKMNEEVDLEQMESQAAEIKKNKYLDEYIDEQLYADTKNQSQDQIKQEEKYEFNYSEYDEFWEDLEPEVKPNSKVIALNEGELNTVTLDKLKIQPSINLAQKDDQTEQQDLDSTFAELDKYPQKFDELDKKYQNFRKETYKANLKAIEQHYMKRIGTLKRAIRVQIRYGRQQARDKAKKILTESVLNLTQQFKKELNSLIDSFQYYKNELRNQDKRIHELKFIVQEQEHMLIQMNTYMQHAGMIIGMEQEEIKQIKNEQKKLIRKGLIKQTEVNAQSLSTAPEFQYYSFYVSMALKEDRNQAVHQELTKNLKTRISELEQVLTSKDHEILSFKNMQEIYDIRDQQFRNKISDLENQIQTKNFTINTTQRRIEDDLTKQLQILKEKNTQLEEQLKQCLFITNQEVAVNEQIREKQEKVINQLKREMKELKMIFKIPRLRNIHMDQVKFEELKKLKMQDQFGQSDAFSSSEGGLTQDLNRFHAYVTSAPANLPQKRVVSNDRNKFDDGTISSELKRKLGLLSERSSKGFETERGSTRNLPKILRNKDDIVKKLLSKIDNGITSMNIDEMQKTMTRNQRIKESMSYSQLPSVPFNFDSLITTHDVSKNLGKFN